MLTTEINKVIEKFNLLPLDEMEYVADIIHKQLVEYRREEIAKLANDARNDLKQGIVKSGSIQDLYKDLEND